MTLRRAGIMGWPVSHSLSPKLHDFWLKQYGIEGSYEFLPVEPENLQTALVKLVDQGFVGVNLTVPHKERALPFMVRAVNTVTLHEDGLLYGLNTDVFGFCQNILEGGYKPDRNPVALLGAGGAARSAIVALIDLGVDKIHLTNRTLTKAQSLAEEFSGKVKIFAWDDRDFLKHISLLVNATSLGMKGQPSLAFDLTNLPLDAFVTDMVYAPLETMLLKEARERGCRTIDGFGMLLHQARPAFKAFFGVDPLVTKIVRSYVLETSL